MDQEDVLGFIQKEDWTPVLKFLHQRKEKIKDDSLLKFSTAIFESEFFSKLENQSVTFVHLEDLYQLHEGLFFLLKDENYLLLIQALAQRCPEDQVYNYANIFPNDPVCKEILKNLKEEFKPQIIDRTVTKITQSDWIEIYNRLFEAINNIGNQSTYFTGSKFITTLKEFNLYHPTYTQYIDLRNHQGKSTSRKIFFYDIIMEQTEGIRVKFINRILNMIEPFDKLRVDQIRPLLNGNNIQKTRSVKTNENHKKVFISYSWGDENHQKWVLDLADKLLAEGIDVLLDRYELRLGKQLTYFIENSINTADRIIIIFTPNYKEKADNRSGGSGYEYSIMNSILYQNQANEKIIPILRIGTQNDSIPNFMQQYIHLDMTMDDNFENSFSDLLREIKDEPVLVKPPIGVKKV